MMRCTMMFLALALACGCWDTGLGDFPAAEPPPDARPADASAPPPSCPVVVGNAFTDCCGAPQPERCIAVPSPTPCYSILPGNPCGRGQVDCQPWEVVSNCKLCTLQSCRN